MNACSLNPIQNFQTWIHLIKGDIWYLHAFILLLAVKFWTNYITSQDLGIFTCKSSLAKSSRVSSTCHIPQFLGNENHSSAGNRPGRPRLFPGPKHSQTWVEPARGQGGDPERPRYLIMQCKIPRPTLPNFSSGMRLRWGQLVMETAGRK